MHSLIALTPPWAPPTVVDAAAGGEDVRACTAVALDVGRRLPVPGGGHTAERWATLAALARANLTAARIAEAHTDALAVLAEAGDGGVPVRDADLLWGVFAAESPGFDLRAEHTANGVRLSGTKPWCSLGGSADAALITARDAAGGPRSLYRVDLHDPGVAVHPNGHWASRGLRTVVSVPLDLQDVPAEPLGEPGWYLRRPGFAWGGTGVAACWFGGALALADTLAEHVARRPGELTHLHLGRVDAALHACDATLLAAAAQIDAGAADGADGALLALRVRAVVADAVEQVLGTVGHALGPAPLAFDPAHAARVADLTVYVRQHHGERDLAALGEQVLR